MSLQDFVDNSTPSTSIKEAMNAVGSNMSDIDTSYTGRSFDPATPFFKATVKCAANLAYALLVHGARFDKRINRKTAYDLVEYAHPEDINGSQRIYIKNLIVQARSIGPPKNWTLDPQGCPYLTYDRKTLVEVMSLLAPVSRASGASGSSGGARKYKSRKSKVRKLKRKTRR
jgi:hypothetical protein